jgi:DNA-binding ferritin-like protein
MTRRARRNIDVDELVRSRKDPVTLKDDLLSLLAVLSAIKWVAWNAHWKAHGHHFYSDHQLFERIYSGEGGGPAIDEQIDGLAERIVAKYGDSALDTPGLSGRIQSFVQIASPPGSKKAPWTSLLLLEQTVLRYIHAALKNITPTDIVLDNYLQTIADERSVAVYLLQRRARLK